MDNIVSHERPQRRTIPPHSLIIVGGLALLLVGALVYRFATLPATAASTAAGTGGTSGGPSTQVNQGGQVSVGVTWPGRAGGVSFDIAMNTHSVNLDGYDLAQLVTLRTDDGREGVPISWNAPMGGHHRSGTLVFSNDGVDGKPLIGPNTKSLQLTVFNVAGVQQRTFTWTLQNEQ